MPDRSFPRQAYPPPEALNVENPSLPPSLPPGTPRPDGPEVAAYALKVRAALQLSPTQALVAIGIWLGMSEKQVAAWLGKARPTIHSHIRSINHRLDVLMRPHGHVGIAIAVERAIKVAVSSNDEKGGVRLEDPAAE